jgi:UDP-N-acetylmuramoyl-L-alanyl-D-glutamate--2,6-diaminopimelate ligase
MKMISNGVKKLIPQFLKNIYHLFQAVLANVRFGFPSRKLKVIGVTGTNGKTTTVQMIAKILEEAGFKIAVASTINFKIAEKEWVNKSKFTTLSSWALQRFLKQAVSVGCEYAIIEVSSHSLDQNRAWGVDFDVATITNVTREHLDYHETMEEYAKAKEKLFAVVSKNKNSVSVVNLNMEFAEKFLEYPVKEKYVYSIENPNVKIQMSNQTQNPKFQTIIAEEIELGINYSKFKIQNSKFFINIPGEFNIENALAATCVGLSQGISLEKISEALAKIKGVPGRMENIENDRGLNIIVDYAVTPDSLEKLYGFIREIREKGENMGKIVAVFGSCGERDRGKRPIMGEIVARHADYCIVTNEDPYHEDPVQIINEVFEGVVGHKVDKQIPNFQFSIFNFQTISNDKILKSKTEGVDAFRILDRREAIKTALQIAKQGDAVVVTGKGAEETMAIGDKMIPWNDPKVIREVL